MPSSTPGGPARPEQPPVSSSKRQTVADRCSRRAECDAASGPICGAVAGLATVILCGEVCGLGFMDAARHEFGLAIPRDLCVVGFDDIEQANWESYKLTTFAQPAAEMVDHIAALLSADNAEPAERRVFAATPVWRRTVRPNAL